ncbi:MAG: hypothetical protein ACQETE_10800 [Bacteroidota bacterium]
MYLRSFLITVLLGLALHNSLKAQVNTEKLTLHAYGGYGTYNMSDMRSFFKTSSEQPYLKLVDDFPAHYNLGIRISMPKGPNEILDVHLEIHSTGSKANYSDYSGDMGLTLIADGIFAGVGYYRSFQKNSNKSFDFYWGGKTGFSYGDITLNSYMDLYEVDYHQSDEISFNSIGAYLTPSLLGQYNITDHFSVNFHLGYSVSLVSRLRYKDNEVYFEGTNDNVNVNWSGFRTGISIGYLFDS